MTNTKINAFIFDCFGVICDSIYNAWYEKNLLSKGVTDENLKATLERFDLGRLSEDDMVDYFRSYDGVDMSKEEMRRQIDSGLAYNEALAQNIKKLKDLGFKTALLSNGNAGVFERKIYKEFKDFRGLFDVRVISSEVGMTKPGKEIYEHALKELGSKAEESVFVDDREENVEGARMVGMNGFLFVDNEGFEAFVLGLGIDL